jgi:hypothetical protein
MTAAFGLGRAQVAEGLPPLRLPAGRLIEFAHDANRRLLDRANFWRASSASSVLWCCALWHRGYQSPNPFAIASGARPARHTARGPIARQGLRSRWAWQKSDSLIAALLGLQRTRPVNQGANLLDDFRRAVSTLRVSARLVVDDLPILFLVSEIQSRAECPMRFQDCLSD